MRGAVTVGWGLVGKGVEGVVAIGEVSGVIYRERDGLGDWLGYFGI